MKDNIKTPATISGFGIDLASKTSGPIKGSHVNKSLPKDYSPSMANTKGGTVNKGMFKTDNSMLTEKYAK